MGVSGVARRGKWVRSPLSWVCLGLAVGSVGFLLSGEAAFLIAPVRFFGFVWSPFFMHFTVLPSVIVAASCRANDRRSPGPTGTGLVRGNNVVGDRWIEAFGRAGGQDKANGLILDLPGDCEVRADEGVGKLWCLGTGRDMKASANRDPTLRQRGPPVPVLIELMGISRSANVQRNGQPTKATSVCAGPPRWRAASTF